MLLSILYIIGGFLVLAWAADRFVDGASAIARYYGLSPLLIGVTIVALGTSAPEMVVAIFAASKGSAGLAIGNAIGSNIANTGLVLGLTALISSIRVRSQILKREYPVLGMVMVLAWILMVDGVLSYYDGLILLLGLCCLLLWLVQTAKREEDDVIASEFQAEIPKPKRLGPSIINFVIGLGLLPLCSHLIVLGCSVIAKHFGISDLIIGLTIVAIGTSLPEVATSVTAALRGEEDIAIGNVIGSNMFNLLAVLPFPGLIAPGAVDNDLLTRDIPVMFLTSLLVVIFTVGWWRGDTKISRPEGGVLLVSYAAYLAWLVRAALL